MTRNTPSKTAKRRRRNPEDRANGDDLADTCHGSPAPDPEGAPQSAAANIPAEPDLCDTDEVADEPPPWLDLRDSEPDDETVGYKCPPRGSRWKKGVSGNPSGRRKAKTAHRRPLHAGNAMNRITKDFVAALNDLMLNPLRLSAPTKNLSGAQLFARAFFRDAMAKDGFARRRLFDLFVTNKLDSDLFQAKDKSAMDADIMSAVTRLLINPNATEEDVKDCMEKMYAARDEEDWP